jgi:hypothetical protein
MTDPYTKDKGEIVSVHDIKHREGAELQLHSSLTWASDGGKRSNSRTQPLCTRERTQLMFAEEVLWAAQRVWTIWRR